MKGFIGVIAGRVTLRFPEGVVPRVPLTTGLMIGALIFNIVQNMNNFECDNIIFKFPMERVGQTTNFGVA